MYDANRFAWICSLFARMARTIHANSATKCRINSINISNSMARIARSGNRCEPYKGKSANRTTWVSPKKTERITNIFRLGQREKKGSRDRWRDRERKRQARSIHQVMWSFPAKIWPKNAKNYLSTWRPRTFKTSTFGITWCDNFWPNLWLEVAKGIFTLGDGCWLPIKSPQRGPAARGPAS